jgi:hypothetical protein
MNMEIFSNGDRLALRDLFWEEVPEHLLFYISAVGSCRRDIIVKEAIRWLPSQMVCNTEREQIIHMLDWFEARGDIYYAPSGLCRCLPPYSIGTITDLSVEQMPLYGNPAIERDLEYVIKDLGGILHKSKQFESREIIEGASKQAIQPVGVERTLCLPKKDRNELTQRLSKIGLTIFSLEELRSNLPFIGELSFPGVHSLRELPDIKGLWEIYTPSQPCIYQAGRWMELSDHSKVATCLVRCIAGKDGQYFGGYRYFLCSDNRMAMELTRDDATWWQFRLDKDANNPTVMYFCQKKNEIWINGYLPRTIYQWLRFISRKPLELRKYWHIYPVSSSQLEMASDVLEECLGIEPKMEMPPEAI